MIYNAIQNFVLLNGWSTIQMAEFWRKDTDVIIKQTNKPPKYKTKTTTTKQLLQKLPHNYVFWNIFPDSYESQIALVESKKPKACFWENSYFFSDASRLKTSLM